jgi:hypothetical protein
VRQTAKIILFGLSIWSSVFIGAMFIFRLRESDRLFFETLIGFILVFFATFYTVLYFRKVNRDFLREGIRIGIIWMITNLAVDIPMFSFGPLARPLWEYLKDIGFAYFSIPVITIGIGYMLSQKTPGTPAA